MPKPQALIFSIVLVFSGPQITQAQVFSNVTDGYNPTGIYEVDDIYQDAKDTKPSFLKDILFGSNDKRPIHKSTLKLYDILGKAQKGLQTYKSVKQVYKGITEVKTPTVLPMASSTSLNSTASSTPRKPPLPQQSLHPHPDRSRQSRSRLCHGWLSRSLKARPPRTL